MKIAFISTYAQPCGIATYTSALARNLKKQGHEILVLTERQPALQDAPKRDEDGIMVMRVWTRGGSLLNLIPLLEKAEIQVVHLQHEFGIFPEGNEVWAFLSEVSQRKFKTVVTLHTVTQPPTFAGFFSTEWPIKLTTIVHTYTQAAVVHAWKRPYISRDLHVILHGAQVRSLPPWDAARRELKIQDSDLVFLTPGFVAPSKGIVEILHGFAHAWQALPHARLLIVGECRDAGYYNTIENVIFRLGIGHRMKFIAAFQKDNAMFFAASNAIVLGGETTDPFARPGFEHFLPYSASGQLAHAAGYGLPILAKNCPIYLGNRGVLYYSNPTELATLMVGMNHRALRNSVGIDTLRGAQERPWNKIAEEHAALYAS